MKKNFIYLLLLCSLIAQAQVTPSYPTIKLTKTVEGVKQDSLLVVGTDKIVKHIPYSKISNVQEYATASALPVTGVAGKLYITKDNNKIYTWNGTFYQELADNNNVKLTGDQQVGGEKTFNGRIFFGDQGGIYSSIRRGDLGSTLYMETNQNTPGIYLESKSAAAALRASNNTGGKVLDFGFNGSGGNITNAGVFNGSSFVKRSTPANNLLLAGGGDIAQSDLVNVIEVNDVPSLPLIGEAGKIYVVKNVNKIYRWNGTFYQELAVTDISGLQAQIDLKANLASPSLTGTPTAPTAAAGTNTTQIATMEALQAAKQDLQSVLDKGNVTTEPFYNEFDAGSGNYVRNGVIPVSGTPFPIVGQAVSNAGQLIEIGMAPHVNGGFIVNKTGAVNKKVNFAFPDKPNDSYPSPSLYTLATTEEVNDLQTALDLKANVSDVVPQDLQSVIETGNIATVDYDKFFGISTDGVSATFISPFGVSINSGTATTYINEKTISRNGVNISLFSERDPGNYTLATVEDINNLQSALDSKANDTDVVKLTGNQTIYDTKSFNNLATSNSSIVIDANSGGGGAGAIHINNKAQNFGLRIEQSNGNYTSAGILIRNNNISNSVLVDYIPTTGYGRAYEGRSGGVTTFLVDNLGEVSGSKFIKSSTPTNNILLAGGGDIAQSDLPISSVTQVALDLKANDSDVVHKSGNETISGIKTFNDDIVVNYKSLKITGDDNQGDGQEVSFGINSEGNTEWSVTDINTDKVTLNFNVNDGFNFNKKANFLGTVTATSYTATSLPVFENNAAASSLAVGQFYRTSTGVLMVKF